MRNIHPPENSLVYALMQFKFDVTSGRKLSYNTSMVELLPKY
jgi:hypothetical protein